jgi:uncharacterized RDD family membrane protein YckC
VTPPGPLDRVLGAIVQPVVGAVDVEEIVAQIDVDELVGQVDVNALVKRVDVDDIVQRVDVDALVQRVDVDAIVERVDVDALMDRVDVERLLARIDLDTLLTRVDLDTVLARVDVNTLLDRLDVNAVVARVDAEALMQRVDVDALMGRIDLDAVLARVDVESLVQRANIDAIVRDASRGVFSTSIDLVRRQLVGLDQITSSLVNRVLRRPVDHESLRSGTVTGRVGGAISRLAAFLIDVGVLSLASAFTASVVAFMLNAILGGDVDSQSQSLAVVSSASVIGFLYYWIGLSITGKSIGKGLVGLRVVARDGRPITPGRSAVRTLVYPLSFILGLGLIPIVTGRRHRALHDWAGRDEVRYDWGDRPAEMPAPLTAFLRRQSGIDVDIEPHRETGIRRSA